MLAAGKLTAKIAVERLGDGSNDYGEETGAWSQLFVTMAQVMNGTGAERRQAAQESPTTTVTFRIRRNPTTVQITPKDRIRYAMFGVLGPDSPVWDVASIVEAGRDAIDVTSTRAE